MTTNLNQLTYLHIVGAELHTGMLVLASACVLMRVFFDAYRIMLASRMPARLAFVERLMKWLTPYLDRTSLIAMLGGIGAFCMSVITGFYVWENGRPMDEGVMQNKVIFSSIGLTLWLCAILIRLRFTEALWGIPRLSNLYVLVVTGAMGFTMFAGALGARLTVGNCFFDPLFEEVGWDPADPLTASPFFSMMLMVLGLIFLLAFFKLDLLRSIKNEQPGG